MHCGQFQPQFLAPVQAQRLERARFAHHGQALPGQALATQRDFGNVAQLFQRFSKHHARPLHLGAHHGIVTGHGTGVGGGRFTRRTAFAGVQQHHQLAQLLRPPGSGQQALRVAERFSKQRQHASAGFLQGVFQIVFNGAGRLVAGRDSKRQRQSTIGQRAGHHGHHRAALREEGDVGLGAVEGGLLGADVGIDEGQRHAVQVINAAQAVRAFNDHARRLSNTGHLLLLGQPFGPTFSKAGGKNHHRPGFATGQGTHGIQHGRLRNGQHGHIHPLGQVIDRGQAGATIDLGAFGVDEVDGTVKAVALQVGQQLGTQGTGRRRCANDGNRARAQHAPDRRSCCAGRGLGESGHRYLLNPGS